jgi:hypothetical protein
MFAAMLIFFEENDSTDSTRMAGDEQMRSGDSWFVRGGERKEKEKKRRSRAYFQLCVGPVRTSTKRMKYGQYPGLQHQSGECLNFQRLRLSVDFLI